MHSTNNKAPLPKNPQCRNGSKQYFNKKKNKKKTSHAERLPPWLVRALLLLCKMYCVCVFGCCVVCASSSSSSSSGFSRRRRRRRSRATCAAASARSWETSASSVDRTAPAAGSPTASRGRSRRWASTLSVGVRACVRALLCGVTTRLTRALPQVGRHFCQWVCVRVCVRACVRACVCK